MTGPPPCPFGTSWDRLKLAELRSFLSGNPSERAIWEAKSQGSKAQIADAVRKESCGFANRRGGYVLLGARERKGSVGWDLEGLTIAGVRELHDWVASLLRELDPIPMFDVHEWDLPNGNKIAVIQIEEAPLKPVTMKGQVYQRHGSQTRKVEGSAIRRLAAEGERAERLLAKTASQQARSLVGQIWVSAAVALARPGERPFNLGEHAPEHVLREELNRALRARFRSRKLIPLTWDAVSEQGGLLPRSFSGWRVGVQTEQASSEPFKTRRSPNRPKVDPSTTDRDMWAGFLLPGNVASAFVLHLPVRRHPMEAEFGDRAIGNAALMLRALIATERRLGARPSEQTVVVVGLRDWDTNDVVTVQRTIGISDNITDWRRDVTAEAGKRLHLKPA